MNKKKINLLCMSEFEKVLEELQKKVDRSFARLPENERWRTAGYKDCFHDTIIIKFGATITIDKESLKKNSTLKKIKELFRVKKLQLYMSMIDMFEMEIEDLKKVVKEDA